MRRARRICGASEQRDEWLKCLFLKWSRLMQVSATEAKNRFGYYLGQAEREPVQVMKNDRVAVVMVSAARYAELESLEQSKSLGQRKREFNDTYADWIAAQNQLVEQVGVFGEEHRPW